MWTNQFRRCSRVHLGVFFWEVHVWSKTYHHHFITKADINSSISHSGWRTTTRKHLSWAPLSRRVTVPAWLRVSPSENEKPTSFKSYSHKWPLPKMLMKNVLEKRLWKGPVKNACKFNLPNWNEWWISQKADEKQEMFRAMQRWVSVEQ